MTPEIEDRITHVYMSANLCNEALTEIFYLSQTISSKEEAEIVNSHTFNFYRVALQYCFNSEYNKILEPVKAKDKKKPNKNIASIFNLNEHISDFIGNDFNLSYESNKVALHSLVNSDFQDKQRLLRNKKFSHSDYSPINDPLKIKGLTEEEIQEGFEHLKIIFAVINKCAEHFNYSYLYAVPHNDDRTRNFIKFHSTYKKYFYDNYSKAFSEGYSLK